MSSVVSYYRLFWIGDGESSNIISISLPYSLFLVDYEFAESVSLYFYFLWLRLIDLKSFKPGVLGSIEL